jgi:hypothetical protein
MEQAKKQCLVLYQIVRPANGWAHRKLLSKHPKPAGRVELHKQVVGLSAFGHFSATLSPCFPVCATIFSTANGHAHHFLNYQTNGRALVANFTVPNDKAPNTWFLWHTT